MPVGDELGEDVGGEDFGEGTEAEEGILRWGMGVGRGFAVAADEDLIATDDDEDHAGGEGLEVEVGAEGVYGLRVWELCRGLRLSLG